MANPQLLKRIETTTGEEESSKSITCLPRDMLVQIASKVASQSLADLHHLKLTSKEMMNITDDSYIYKHASLDKVPFFRIQEIPQEASFLTRCRSSGNLESLYREGMKAYFRNYEHCKKGLDVVRMAAQEGHKRSKYAFAMIVLMNWSDTRSGFSMTEEFHEALGNLRFLRNQKCVIRCRNKVAEFVQVLTSKMGSGVLRQFPTKDLCENVNCRDKWRFNSWIWAFVVEDDDDDENDPNVCENCRCYNELLGFCAKAFFFWYKKALVIDASYMLGTLIKQIR